MNRMLRILVALACFALLSRMAQAYPSVYVDDGTDAWSYTSTAGSIGATFGGAPLIVISADSTLGHGVLVQDPGGSGGAWTSINGGLDVDGGAAIDTLSVSGILNATGGVNLGNAIGDATVVSGTFSAAGGLATIGSTGLITGVGLDAGTGLIQGTGGANITAGGGNWMLIDEDGAGIGGQFSGLDIYGSGAEANANGVVLVSDNDGNLITDRAMLSMIPTSASLTVATGTGQVHGLWIEQDQTVISGGTNSTTLILDDSGATFATDGAPARVTGIADGIDPFDAVNRRQLEGLDNKVGILEQSLSAGIASIAALNAIPDPVCGKNNCVGVGYGHYNAESAFAVGVKANLPNSGVSLAAGMGFSNHSGPAANAGASFSF